MEEIGVEVSKSGSNLSIRIRRLSRVFQTSSQIRRMMSAANSSSHKCWTLRNPKSRSLRLRNKRLQSSRAKRVCVQNWCNAITKSVSVNIPYEVRDSQRRVATLCKSKEATHSVDSCPKDKLQRTFLGPKATEWRKFA